MFNEFIAMASLGHSELNSDLRIYPGTPIRIEYPSRSEILRSLQQ